jgi:MarR family 2-MHQ and catechol resistance regulon transcriptional repressor
MSTHYDGNAREIRALDTFIKLSRAAETVGDRLEPGLRQAGLTGKQLGVLEMLWHLGPLCQHEIGDKLLMSRANITLIVRQLAREQLVRRERVEEDRRYVRVSLTAEGRKKIARIFPGHVSRIVEAMAPLSRSEQTELGRLCRKLGLGLSPR